MKGFIVNVLKAFSGVVEGPAKAGVQTLAYFINQVDIPESDGDTWNRVQSIVVETLDNIAVSSALDSDKQAVITDAVVHRATVQLKELGLLKGA